MEPFRCIPLAPPMRMVHRIAQLLLLLGVSLGPALISAPETLEAQATGPQVTITEFPLPSAVPVETPRGPRMTSLPGGIVAGPDGALWFYMSATNRIGRITTTGQISEYPIPIPNASQLAQGFLGVGPDGAIWFTMNAPEVNRIGRMSLDGRFSDYPIPTPNGGPFGIAAGPDGAVWFTETDANQIGRIAMDGRITEYALPTPNSRPLGIVGGPDGALWFTMVGTHRIGRITTSGAITQYDIPTPASLPLRLTTGPDGAIWFTEGAAGVNQIGRLARDGAVTEYAVPWMGPGITTGPDGAVWFTGGNQGNGIGRLTLDGGVTAYPIPTENSFPFHIVTGPDGALWFTELDTNKIGRIQIRGVPTAPTGVGLPRTGGTSVATWWLVGGAAGACGLGALLRRRWMP